MKPIKETKLGIWLKDKAPKILDKVGDLLPDSGGLGILKNIISSELELDPKAQVEGLKMAQELEIEMIRDLQNARAREIDFVKSTGHIDWMQTLVGVLVMVCFIGSLFLIGFRELPKGSEHLMINAIGIMEGLVLAVVGYYYGSSAGSRIKDMRGK